MPLMEIVTYLVSPTSHNVILNHRLHGKGGNVNLCGIMKNDYNIL